MKDEMKGKDGGGRGSGISHFIKDIGVSKWKERQKKKEPFPSLYIFLHSPLFYVFPQLLKSRKTQEMSSLKKFFFE